MSNKCIIVIGAGASGMMAAGRAAEAGAKVMLLEKMNQPGKKILITGQTRCNISNSKDLNDFISQMGANGRFLHNAFHRYFRDDLLAFLKRYGIKTKSESDGRIFPVSNNSHDVVKALRRYLSDHHVQVLTGMAATRVETKEGQQVSGVLTNKGSYRTEVVILATGGASFPGTGSTGDGYRMAKEIGHTIVKLRPSLVPVVVQETEVAKSMQGASLQDVRLTAYACASHEIDSYHAPTNDLGRGTGHERPPWPLIASRRGDLMLTHLGIGGPITLQMSLAIVDALENGPVSVSIDLKPDIEEKHLNQQLQQNFDKHGRRSCRRILNELLPHKMVEPFIAITGITSDKHANKISAEERKRMVKLLKSLRFNIKGPLSIASAMVTAGGVSLDEVEPRTMASRLIKGLYLCGEVLDLDGNTGGYNLQTAFSTGYVAGEEAAKLFSRL